MFWQIFIIISQKFQGNIILVIVFVKHKTLTKKLFSGALIGFVSGMFGAGGGIIAVPILNRYLCDVKASHRASVAVVLPLAIVSFSLYLLDSRFQFSDGLPFIVPGLLGAIIGTFLLSKLKVPLIKRLFGIIIIYFGIRLIIK